MKWITSKTRAARGTPYSVLSTPYLVLVVGFYFLVLFSFYLFAFRENVACAQDPRGSRLMDQPPFDILTLDRSNDNKVYKVYPVALPDRRVPEKPRPSDKIRIRVMDTNEEYDVAWEHIEKLELYEHLVLAEAQKFTAEGKLDDAYDSLQFLVSFYPHTPGLAEGRQYFLYTSSGAAFRQQKFDQALSLLEELHSLNPDFKAGDPPVSVLQRLGVVADRLIANHVAANEYTAARLLLTRLTRQYKLDREPFARKWREELVALATRHLENARVHLSASRYLQAHEAAAQVQVIWPDLPGARDVIAQVAVEHPLVRVAVDHPARAFDPRSLTDPAARRAGRLVSRLLMEQTALGIEGGAYNSPIAAIDKSDDGLSLALRLTDPSVEGYLLAQHLLSRAVSQSDNYNAGWARLVAAIDLRSPSEVQIAFRRPPLLPEARLQFPLADFLAAPAPPYAARSTENDVAQFALSKDHSLRQPGQPAEVIEQYFSDPQRAIVALKRGEVDVLARIFPGDIPALKSDPSITVAAYARPTAQVLLPSGNHPYLAKAAFRRALLYSANRELLLNQGLLRGAAIPGARVISSPFPAAVPGLATPAYGYDEQIEPRAFDARLGMALVLLAESEVKSAYQKQERQAPKREPLTLGHPADEISRIACRGLVKDWKRIGVECQLVEFPPGVFADPDGKCDLVYLQLAAWEPLLDAERLFGDGGLAPAQAPAMKLALREIQSARNWQEARRLLTTLHRLVHEDVTVLPLWQTVDHYAFRPASINLAAPRLHLYQDIETWRPGAAAAGGQP